MVYCYKCPYCHKTFRKVRPLSQCDTVTTCECGSRAERDIVAEHSETPHHPGNWPMKSTALGVTPRQIPEAVAQAAAKGQRLDFTPDGRAIFDSPGHRKAVCRALGFHDRNGGYADP
jgi:hypothetical protein